MVAFTETISKNVILVARKIIWKILDDSNDKLHYLFKLRQVKWAPMR